MRIHILGICGTFMSGIAVIAKQQGHQVTGSDEAVYPPMSTQLMEQGIKLEQGYAAAHLQPAPDCVVVGNAMSRGKPAVEYMLNENLNYTSGPQWLAENILKDKWVLAVAGTHGKTTTTSMVAWILEYAGLNPGFLIGGIPKNFGVSARYTNSQFFVIEADEYDSAFFDKRSKFLHFHPRTLILNCLEFDHADIFENLEAIKKQFHYLVRTVPGNGLIVNNQLDQNLQDVLHRGCWTPVQNFVGENSPWKINLIKADGSEFEVIYQGEKIGTVKWNLLGEHNLHNALAAMSAAIHAGVNPEQIIAALNKFEGVKRRLELRGEVKGIKVYDDFAHHPTAIATTLAGLRANVKEGRILVAAEFASYTMKTGHHREHLADSFAGADYVVMLKPLLDWDINEVVNNLTMPAKVLNDVPAIIEDLIKEAKPGDHILIMSNKGFGGIHEKLLAAL